METTTPNRNSLVLRMALWIVLATYFGACGPSIGPTPAESVLRVINVGARNVGSLVVLFPHDRVEFGDLPVGFTSAYRTVPNGVFRYAAYEFQVDGLVQHQPVIDWVGEQPMEGEAFTYSLELIEEPSLGPTLRLVTARRDS
jgi:hypothetical protein